MTTRSWIRNLNLGWLYKGYLRTLAALGQALEMRRVPAHPAGHREVAPAASPADDGRSLQEIDLAATVAGNHYRAFGISVGLIGIAIVFLAIVPVGLDPDPHLAHLLGGLKVVLMVLMLSIVIVGRRADTRRRWVALRAQAETLRYRPLAELIERSKTPAHDALTLDALERRLGDILEGPQGQIAYNALKARQFQAIEHFSNVMLWVSVVLALVGAVGHLVVDESWWIFLTAFGPAAVGGLHGINGFLNISGLTEEHEAMERSLTESLNDLEELRRSPARDTGLPKLAESVLATLTSRDINWVKSAEKQNLSPA